MGSVLADFEEMTEYYPGSRHPIVRHPNRAEPHKPDPEHWDAKPRILKVAGVDTEFFTVGQLAQALGRKPVTMRKWERSGIIPKPTFRKPSEDPRGQRRLYTRAQVTGMRKIAEEEGLLREKNQRKVNHTDFTKRVIALFRELAAQ